MSEPVFPYSEEVTRIRREKIGVDKYGNDVRENVGTVVPGAVVWPETTSTETEGDRDTITSGMMLLLPAGFAAEGTDKFMVRGRTFGVHGEPADYSSNPFTNSRAGVLVRLRRITG